MRTKGKATLIRKITGGNWQGNVAIYRLDPPLSGSTFVLVSAVNVPFSGPETYIFAAKEDGEPKNYSELPGSFKGALNHIKALCGAGYEVVQ